MSVRVYQFAKAKSVPNKEVIDALAKIGATVTSHMAIIPEDLYSKLEAAFDKKSVIASKLETSEQSGIKKIDPVNVDKYEKKSIVDPKGSASLVNKPSGNVSKSSGVGVEKSASVKRDFVKNSNIKNVNPVGLDLDSLIDDGPIKSSEVPATLIEDLERGFSSYGKNTGNYAEAPRPRKRRKFKHKKIQQKPVAPTPVQSFKITGPMQLGELAEALGRKTGDILLYFLKNGKIFALNNLLNVEQIKQACIGLGIELIEEQNLVGKKDVVLSELRTVDDKNSVSRKPVVVVMGHVDHGKTSLLDYIRKAKVAIGEHGGITQSISAYEVPVGNGIVFIDTPGHEAFSMMRGCGARITDLAIILIAADDGIMPQTAESIEIAKKSGCQIMIVINKIDKPGLEKSIENIKTQLTQKYGILVEEWGGSVVCCGISAKTGEGVEHLLEMIALQAEVLDLKARVDVPGSAFVLESRFERGHGAVATLIVTEGKVCKLDFFTCDGKAGKIKHIEDFTGKSITQALPSKIIKVVGLDGIVSPGSILKVVPMKQWLAVKNGKQAQTLQPETGIDSQKFDSSQMSMENDKRIKVLIKTSTGGTLDALLKAIESAKKRNASLDKNFLLVGISAGEVSSSDVTLAADFDATIMTFATTVDRKAVLLASEKNVEIEHYKIVYKLIERIEEIVKSRLDNEIIHKEVGQAEVIQVFNFKGKGVIAGCKVTEGKIARPGKITCIRNGQVIAQSKTITSLQHVKKSATEVKKGLECGFMVDGFDGWEIGDKIICHQALKRSESL